MELAVKFRAREGKGIFPSLDLYPLNRFLFHVEAPSRPDVRKLSPSPWFLTKDGAIHLALAFHGWSGPVPDPLREFDEFRRDYPRRTISALHGLASQPASTPGLAHSKSDPSAGTGR